MCTDCNDPFAGLEDHFDGKTFNPPAAKGSKVDTKDTKFPCTVCNGTGRYQGFRTQQMKSHCFACKGKGFFLTSERDRRKARASAASRKTRSIATARAAFEEQNPGMSRWIEDNVHRSDFLSAMLAALDKYGSLTDRQADAVRRQMETRKETPAMQTSNTVDSRLMGFEPVEQIFAHIIASGNDNFPSVLCQTNAEVDGDDVIRLDVRFTRMSRGKNTGKVKVEVNKEWAGYITGGTWDVGPAAKKLTRDEKVALWTLMQQVKADPEAVFAAFGKRVGRCSACGLPLSNEKSVALGIGPICRSKMGF